MSKIANRLKLMAQKMIAIYLCICEVTLTCLGSFFSGYSVYMFSNAVGMNVLSSLYCHSLNISSC